MPRLRLTFRAKLWGVLCGLVFVALAFALKFAEDATLNRVQADSLARFQRTLAAFSELQRLRAELLDQSIETLSRANPQLRSILSTASLAGSDLGFGPEPSPAAQGEALRDANLRLQSALPSLALHDSQRVFAVASATGELLYSKADPDRYGQDLSQLDIVRHIADSGRGAVLWLDTDPTVDDVRIVPEQPSPAAYLVRGKPVVFQEEIHGLVLAGEPIDRDLLIALRAISGVDVALIAGPQVLATTLSVADAGWLGRVLDGADAASNAGGIAELSLGGTRYLAFHAEVVPGVPVSKARFVLLTSLDAELATYRALSKTLMLAGIATMAAALVVGYLLARGITRPLAALRNAARRIGAGEFDVPVNIKTGDELEELGDAFNDMAAGLRERELIKRTLERYVSRGVAAELLREPGQAALAGVRRELTVLFVDLAGFTSLAERMTPEAVVAHLNEYFEAVCSAVLDEDGTVKEFQGDGVVAFWGAPIAQPDHAVRACRAALAAAARLDVLCASWAARGVPAPSYRMGLHTAELIAGEIGSQERGTYGIVGDGMNLASRIEGMNKFYGTRILISEATRVRAGDEFVVRELDVVRVVGRRAPVKVFELIAHGSRPDLSASRSSGRYADALNAYRNRDWNRAAQILDDLLETHPDDAPARVLAARVASYRAAPPPADWDGVFALDRK